MYVFCLSLIFLLFFCRMIYLCFLCDESIAGSIYSIFSVVLFWRCFIHRVFEMKIFYNSKKLNKEDTEDLLFADNLLIYEFRVALEMRKFFGGKIELKWEMNQQELWWKLIKKRREKRNGKSNQREMEQKMKLIQNEMENWRKKILE